MNIGFSTISTQLPSSEKQIRSTMLRFHLLTVVLLSSFQQLQKKKKIEKIEKIPMSFNVVRNSVIFDLLVSQENVGVLQSKLKKLLTHLIKLKLFQPQFCLKSGFSINSLLSKVNIYEQFLVCKKIVRNHLIPNQLKPHTVPITNQPMRSVALARQKYNESLENKKSDREKESCSNEK